MSIEDLKEQHILLPEKEWGIHKLRTTVLKVPFSLLILSSIAGLVFTYVGGGRFWTWIGITVFFVSFFGIILLCDRAIIQQKARKQQEIEEAESS